MTDSQSRKRHGVGDDGDNISQEQERRLRRIPYHEELGTLTAPGRPWVDKAMEMATTLAASRLDEMSKAGEALTETRHQQAVFRVALEEVQDGWVDQSEIRLELPNWSPIPGGVDVIARDEEKNQRIAAELKLWKTEWMLWDALKMIDALNLGELEAAYMVLGTTQAGWTSRYRICPADGKTTELFAEGEVIHDTAQLFSANAHAWYELLTDSTARPTRVPAAISTEMIADAPMNFGNKPGSMRTMRVASASDDWIEFSQDWYEGEWPVGVRPCDHYLEWRGIEPQTETDV